MYFKGIIKNNETNFLACRIIGFVALIFLFFSERALCAQATDVIAKSSFPLSGFFIIFIHVFSPLRPFLVPSSPLAHPATAAAAAAENAISFYARRPGYHSPALLPLIKSSNLDRFMRYIIFYCYVLHEALRPGRACAFVRPVPFCLPPNTHTHIYASLRVIHARPAAPRPQTHSYVVF